METKPQFIVGITGSSGSGKTSFLNKITEQFDANNLCLISQDNYYKKRDKQPIDENGVMNFDLPESIDLEGFAEDIQTICEGKVVEKEEYTFNNDQKEPEVLIFKPAPILVVEGIFVFFYEKIQKLLDLKVIIDVEQHLGMKRRIIRDNEERGYDLDDVLYRYEKHVFPAYRKYIEPFKYEADLIVPNNRNFENAVNILTTFFKSKIDTSLQESSE